MQPASDFVEVPDGFQADDLDSSFQTQVVHALSMAGNDQRALQELAGRHRLRNIAAKAFATQILGNGF
jgi:hypothetical protein